MIQNKKRYNQKITIDLFFKTRCCSKGTYHDRRSSLMNQSYDGCFNSLYSKLEIVVNVYLCGNFKEC